MPPHTLLTSLPFDKRTIQIINIESKQSTYFELVRGGQLRVKEREGAGKQLAEEGWK
jgi:hypothetical protein